MNSFQFNSQHDHQGLHEAQVALLLLKPIKKNGKYQIRNSENAVHFSIQPLTQIVRKMI